MVRIGDSFFGHKKEAATSEMHSGSKMVSWGDPGHDLLELTRKVTEAGDFSSMNVDVFETQDGDLFVNECQTVFGCSVATVQMKIDEKEARYLYEDGHWQLEFGGILSNHMCNHRIECLLSILRNC